MLILLVLLLLLLLLAPVVGADTTATAPAVGTASVNDAVIDATAGSSTNSSAATLLPSLTMCCNWRTKPRECGIGTPTSWLCTAECRCTGPGWVPQAWKAEIASASLLVASPDEPGATISNGYVGAWVPRGLPGSAGAAVCGVEHVKGVFVPSATHPFPSPLGNPDYQVHLAALASWTATAFVASIGAATLPATTSASDLARGAYRVASAAKAVHCVQTTFAHRSRPHLIISEFECTNEGESVERVIVDAGRCEPTNVDKMYIYKTLCPTSTVSNHGYSRQSRPSDLAGVSCSISTASRGETPGSPIPLLGECHTNVPAGGLVFSVASHSTQSISLISARYSNMDDGRLGNSTIETVALARRAWLQANASSGSLFAEHTAAMDELHRPGIEVEGNLELAQVVNASLHALLGSYRADSPYSSAPEGLVSTRYSGHAFWVRSATRVRLVAESHTYILARFVLCTIMHTDLRAVQDVETWQWPTFLVFWPDQAKALLQYRVALGDQARKNAENTTIFLHDFPTGAQSQKKLEGMRFPWESATAGVEQCIFNAEDHIVGDISTAFRQYWRATHDLSWLKSSGFPIMMGIAQFYASRVTRASDGSFHILYTLGPDEYHGNITDSTYGNAVGAASLMSAYQLAPLVGLAPNATFRHIAENLIIPYNQTGDYHPEYQQSQWDARQGHLIKQADTVLMYYPLAVPNISESTKRNDVRMYAALQDPHGVAMTWGIQSIVSLDIGDLEQAATYFTTGYKVFARAPFFTWHEGKNKKCRCCVLLQSLTAALCDDLTRAVCIRVAGNGTDGSSSQGAPNLVTGAGGFLQNVWAGYGGIRFERDDALTIRSPRPLPNSTRLRLRGVQYLGALLDVEAAPGFWTVAL
jgi:hypothetical protein